MDGKIDSSKRAASSYIASSTTSFSADVESKKKARFDTRNPSTLAQVVDEEEDTDPVLELDEVAKSGHKSKRNAVRLEGYDSDSENENFDNRAEVRAREQRRSDAGKIKSKDEAHNDLFADLEGDFEDGDDDEELAREGKKRKKEVRFLDETEIEGQVNTSNSGGHVSADFSPHARRGSRDVEEEESSDDEGELNDGYGVDEELGAGSKKKHAPKLDAFNMKNEQEEGRFDESGNFVRNAADPFALHDQWLEDSKKGDIKKAKEAHDRRMEEDREREMKEELTPTSDYLATAIKHTQPGETILEALQRYGTGKKNQKARWKKNVSRSTEVPMDVDAAEDPIEAQRKEAVEALTGAANELSSRMDDIDNIFNEEHGLFVRLYRRETGQEWKAVGTTTTTIDAGQGDWQYRWEDARDGGETHGPYDTATMAAWQEAGYFGEGVLFKKVGTEEWTTAADFLASAG